MRALDSAHIVSARHTYRSNSGYTLTKTRVNIGVKRIELRGLEELTRGKSLLYPFISSIVSPKKLKTLEYLFFQVMMVRSSFLLNPGTWYYIYNTI